MHPEIRRQLDQIAGDRLSGATDITRRAAGVLAALPVYSDATSTDEFRRELTAVARSLVAAQPSMTSLISLVNRVLLAADTVQDFGHSLVAVQHAAEDFAAELARRPDQIAQTARPLIRAGATVMTISSSSTVFTALRHAHEAGRNVRVICLESRPQREGVDLARRLAELEIDVTLVVDAAMGHFMDRADIVLFGADSVSPHGVVNKIGTHALAVAADAHGVPAYGLAGSEKFLPAGALGHLKIEDQDPREVLNEPVHPRLNVVNLYFDLTPLDFVAGIVTEKDVLTPADVTEQCNNLRLAEF